MSKNAQQAKTYFSEALVKSDYFINDQELKGAFFGKVAERLNLKGEATREAFFALCENRDPNTGKGLTVRTNEDRRVGYDINFHLPKSVSLVHALSQDDHILEAHNSAVRQTMTDIEADAKTRVRKDKAEYDRHTGELIWAEFVHLTARPVDGNVPDPHVHTHCFVFNATWDKQEQKFKAGQFGDIKSDMPYYQSLYHKRLADNLQRLGYNVRRTDKAFEIDGIDKKVLDHFAKRTTEIGRIAKQKGITNAKELAELGARTRAKKQKGLTMAQLKDHWKEQIYQNGFDKGGKAIRQRFGNFSPKLTPEKCLEHAMSHSFERASVVPYRRILQDANRHAIGNPFTSPEKIQEVLGADKSVITMEEKSKLMCTTKEVLAEEEKMVRIARNSKGKMTPLYRMAPEIGLDGEQGKAVERILTTTNRVSIIHGAAGVGKTRLMETAKEHIRKADKKIFAVAPTSEASRGVLRSEGFKDAETVASLVMNKAKHGELKNQVIWCDEAGLLGNKEMISLLELSDKHNARLILAGDTRQHSSVSRGDALRVLNTIAGIETAEVTKIRRQQNYEYRTAVEELSKGKMTDGFGRLNKMGSIKAVDPEKPYEDIVHDYTAALRQKKTALIVSPTHAEGDRVTEAVRNQLKAEMLIGQQDTAVRRYIGLNMTEAQKADWRNFRQGQYVQFNQNQTGAKRGSIWKVHEVSERTVLLRNRDGSTLHMPRSNSKSYDVFERTEMRLTKGDKVRVTRNGMDKNKKDLRNGQTLEVVSVSKLGTITLQNEERRSRFKVGKDFGHLTHAHCITSHASQGKTVDQVFVMQPSSTFGATNAKQFYVSVSRGREKATIYTDDKIKLYNEIQHMGDRQSAMEFVKRKDHKEHIEMLRQRAVEKNPGKAKDKDKVLKARFEDRDYEPGL